MAENRQKTGKRGGRRSTSYRPGQCGNPGGRPKLTPEVVEVRALAQEYTREAVEALVAIMRDSHAPASARASAAGELLDRGHGRAPATIEGTIRHEHVRQMSDTELLEMVAGARPETGTTVQ